MKKQIKLTRIHCAGCAINLEDKVKEVDGVQSASIDFLSKTVTIEVPSKNAKEIIEEVEKTITSFDSSIKIVDTSEEEKQAKKEKIKKIIDISRVCLAVVLAVCALFIKLDWLKITMFMVAYLAVAYEIIILAFVNIFKGKMLDENFLMTIATIGALVLGEYIEAIAVVLLYTIGEFLEKLAVEKSRRRVKSLLSIKADVANLVGDFEESQVPLDAVKIGDIIRIKAGEKVPLDCVVIEGESLLNTSAITGESKEKYVKAGDELLSGSINNSGVLLCKVTKTEKESTVTKIIEMVEKATTNKAKTEKFITKFAKWYTPIVVIFALGLAFIPLAFGGDLYTWGYRALTFLVVSCPCALVISVPLGYFAGIGAAARKGVLVKGASFIDMLANVDNVIFDKTGTLTYGDFEVSYIHAEENSSQEEVLELIAYAESFSNHRIAKSIVKKYNKSINTAWVNDYKEVAGLGVEVELF
ncbi:MAG: heavy metal translocating P-type ATPase [Clostridia bacterium]|nr:heavy metal translocating P-type ATPase [Clostridia bacterium]